MGHLIIYIHDYFTTLDGESKKITLTLSGSEILNDATLMIPNRMVSRLFAITFHLNFANESLPTALKFTKFEIFREK